jgi:hypothetical protein
MLSIVFDILKVPIGTFPAGLLKGPSTECNIQFGGAFNVFCVGFEFIYIPV